MICGFRR